VAALVDGGGQPHDSHSRALSAMRYPVVRPVSRPVTIPTHAKEHLMVSKQRRPADGVPVLVDEPLGDPSDPRDTPPPSQRPGLRGTIVTASGLNVLAGIWLVVAPFVLGYRSGDPLWNDIVFGAIIALLALVRASSAYRSSGRSASVLSWLNGLIGAWLVISAFWLDASGTAAINDIVLGLAVLILGLLSAMSADELRGRRR
jgi:hypothetical protein